MDGEYTGEAHLPTDPDSQADWSCWVEHIYTNYHPFLLRVTDMVFKKKKKKSFLLRKLKCFLARKKKKEKTVSEEKKRLSREENQCRCQDIYDGMS